MFKKRKKIIKRTKKVPVPAPTTEDVIKTKDTDGIQVEDALVK